MKDKFKKLTNLKELENIVQQKVYQKDFKASITILDNYIKIMESKLDNEVGKIKQDLF